MPSYDNSAFSAPPKLLVSGKAEYLFGSYNSRVSPTKLQISAVWITANVAGLTVKLLEGNIPAIGSLISVRGTSQAGGLYNVTNLALTGVTLDANGSGTIYFPLVGGPFTSLADGGQAILPQMEVGETIVAGASIPAAMYFSLPDNVPSRTIQAVVGFPTIPTAATVSLQVAMRNVDSEYVTLTPIVGTVAASAVTASEAQFTMVTSGFVRFLVSGLTGAGTIVGKILV